jgi:phage terminase large subunit-like protein
MTDDTAKWTLNKSDELAVQGGCYFSPKHGEQVCKFIESFCCLSKGRWAGKPLELMDWQRSFIMRLFGWRAANGKRRFRRAYLEIAKKNGKSSLISALSLYLLIADDEGSPEIYINACDKDQASIVFDEALKMAESSPWIRKRVQPMPYKKTMLCGHGKLMANSSDAPKQDGINPHVTIFDELHRQPNRELWDIFAYASAAREQPILLSITTAGAESDGPWYEQREYSEKVTAGIIQDTTHLGIVYRALEDDDIDDPATHLKANPAMGVTISHEDFVRMKDEAKGNPAALQNFKRLRLNIITQGENKFIDMIAWDACGGDWKRPALDSPCYAGLDMSARDDLSALVFIWGDFEAGFDIDAHFWLPEDNIVALEHLHGQPYRQWAADGFITLTVGATIEESWVEARIVELSQRMQIKMLLTDLFNATKVATACREKHGIPAQFLGQGWLGLNEPSKMLGSLIASGKLRHRNNPILRWMASNCVVKMDAAANIKLDKSKRKYKIDGIAALVNALAGAIGEPPDEESVYEHRGILYLDIDAPQFPYFRR